MRHTSSATQMVLWAIAGIAVLAVTIKLMSSDPEYSFLYIVLYAIVVLLSISMQLAQVIRSSALRIPLRTVILLAAIGLASAVAYPHLLSLIGILNSLLVLLLLALYATPTRGNGSA